MYSIVDIETTGGRASDSKITEIAIYKVVNGEIVDSFVSLINPGCYIPNFITDLTGITNQMVSKAPFFYQVAKQIVKITANTTFVAHNAGFDYSFIKEEFSALGYNFELPTLCTVKLSRKILPGHRSYSLGNLCNDLNIELNGRHRAEGDALATVKLFNLLIEKNGGLLNVENPYKRINWELLDSNINLEDIKALPDSVGVFYFKDIDDETILLGKSKSIKQSVIEQLIEKKTTKSKEITKLIHSVDYVLTGCELIAQLLELDDIINLKPKFNKPIKKNKGGFGLFSYLDRSGYKRLVVKLIGEVDVPYAQFSTLSEGQQALYKWIDQFELCEKLSGLFVGNNGCSNYQINQCEGACVGIVSPESYNEKVDVFLASLSLGVKSFVTFFKGRNSDEYSLILVDKGCYKGFGFINKDETVMDSTGFASFINFKDNHQEARAIIKEYLRLHKPLKYIEF